MTDEKIMATIKPDGECWQPEIEKMPREQLEALQVKKLEESIKNIYPNSSIGKKLHNNQQRAFFGTSISQDGFKSYRKSNVNILRTAYEANKKETK